MKSYPILNHSHSVRSDRMKLWEWEKVISDEKEMKEEQKLTYVLWVGNFTRCYRHCRKQNRSLDFVMEKTQ